MSKVIDINNKKKELQDQDENERKEIIIAGLEKVLALAKDGDIDDIAIVYKISSEKLPTIHAMPKNDIYLIAALDMAKDFIKQGFKIWQK